MRPMMPCVVAFLLLLLQLQSAQSANIYGLTSYGRQMVSERLQDLGRVVDADKDSNISPQELVDWARSLGRPDDDKDPDSKELSCVEQNEFEEGLQKAGFSADFAKSYTDFLSDHSISPIPDGCSGLDTQAVLDEAKEGKVDDEALTDFIDGFLQKLIDFCEDTDDAHKDEDLYTSNKDCQTLPTACVTTPYGCESICLQYTFRTTKGRTGAVFDDRAHYQAAASPSNPDSKDFLKLVSSLFQDTNDDGIFSKEEQTDDFKNNFDINEDGCVDEVEFKTRMSTPLCGGFAFSEDFATKRFDAIRGASATGASSDADSGASASDADSGASASDASDADSGASASDADSGASTSSGSCTGIDVNLPDGADMSEKIFISNNIKTLIDMCDAEETLVATNEDCKQLDLICRFDETTKEYDVCKKYVKETDEKDTGSSQSTAVKFFKFLSKWGEKYEDFFGNDK